MPRNLLPFPPSQPTLSFATFCKPKISQAQNGFPRLTRLVFRRRLPVQHIAWTASTTNMDHLPRESLVSSHGGSLGGRSRCWSPKLARVYVPRYGLFPEGFHIRGALISTYQLFIAFGIFLACLHQFRNLRASTEQPYLPACPHWY
jgi:hypothetical protein